MRLLEILFYLLRSSSKVTIKELATVYNVSPRTIQRDLDKLSVLGIPIIIYRGKNGGVIIDGDYVINRQILRNNDYEKLMFSIYISENISKDIEVLNRALDEIRGMRDTWKEVMKRAKSTNQ